VSLQDVFVVRDVSSGYAQERVVNQLYRWWRSRNKVWTNHLYVEEDTMWTRMMSVLSLAITVCSSFAFAGDFEGVIHMKSTFAGDETKVSESDWFIKGDHLRIERRSKNSDQSDSGRMGVMIFNPERKVRYLLIPERKQYIEHSTEEAAEKTAELLKDLKYEIVRTGKADTVAGYRCEIFETKQKDTGKIRGESCAAKGLANTGSFIGLARSDAGKLSSDVPRELRQIIKEGYFLLRMVTKDEDGSEKTRTEAMNVERKKLDNNLFVPPADYTKFDLNAMMQQRTKASQEVGKGDQGQGKGDVQQMIQDMQKRKAERSGASGSPDPAREQMEMQELMKNLGQMMKKNQQGAQ